MKFWLHLYLYLTYYNFFSKILILYQLIILILNLYNLYYGINIDTLNVQLNVIDLDPKLDINYVLNHMPEKPYPDFDKFKVKDIDEILDSSNVGKR